MLQQSKHQLFRLFGDNPTFMVKLNHHFSKLSQKYLFPEIERRIAHTRTEHPQAEILDLGIGDISEPLPKSAIRALSEAVHEMGTPKQFRGYGPSEGYSFLREAIASHAYKGLNIDPSEIFVSDGAQSDIANFQELFDAKNKVALPDPTYPVYLASNVMAGRTRPITKRGRHGGVVYLECLEKNGFQPSIPFHAPPLDLIYLCHPNNPTGVALTRETLKSWVAYARKNGSILLIDGAYSDFITDPEVPRSIYEIEGAQEAAVEFRTFSKSAGFTGLRCSYTVVPHALNVIDCQKKHSLHALWNRRHQTKFNGVAYPIQRAAEALFSDEGKKEVKQLVASYLKRGRFFYEGLKSAGWIVYGGLDSPYLWCKTPEGMASWDFFDHLLDKYRIAAIPGSGFGKAGEGFIRFSAFAAMQALQKALERLRGS